MERPPMSLDRDNRFKKLYENSYEGISLLNESFEILYRSSSAERITGWKTADLLGVAMKDLIHCDDFEHVSESIHQVLSEAGSSQSCRFQILRSNGDYMWLECSVTNMLDDDDVQALVCHYRDITEIKTADQLMLLTIEKLRKEQQHLRLLTRPIVGFIHPEDRMIGGWVIDLIKDTVYWSDVTREIHEVDPGYEPTMQTGLDFYKEESDKILITEKITVAIENGLSFDVELQINTANRRVKWVRVIGEPKFENSKCVRLRGSFQDIDVRKRAELAVIEGLTEKNIILESIGDAFFAVDKNWIVNYWNNKAEKVLYKTRQQTIGYNLWDIFSDSVGSESYKKYYQATQTNEAVHFEDYYPPLLKWYDISAYPSENGLSVYFKDVTERKNISSALEESEKNYSSLFHLSPLPMWVFDLDTLCFLDINAAAVKNYGFSRDEFLAMTIMDIRPGQDVIKVEQVLAIKNSPTQKLIHQGVFRHKKKSGEIIQVEIQSNLIQYKGKPAKIIIANDMTKGYNYTKEIETQNTKLREIAWMQSHVVRAPLSRIMGIVPMLKDWETYAEERETLLDYLLLAANELDDVVKSISDKTNII